MGQCDSKYTTADRSACPGVAILRIALELIKDMSTLMIAVQGQRRRHESRRTSRL
jgi:hypothetical protein